LDILIVCYLLSANQERSITAPQSSLYGKELSAIFGQALILNIGNEELTISFKKPINNADYLFSLHRAILKKLRIALVD
jgi:hypothetical protein